MTSRMGRPATGHVLVNVRLLPPLLERIEAWQAKYGAPNKSAAIRSLIEAGLDATESDTAVIKTADLDK